NATLIVTATGTFTISATPSTRTINRGAMTTYSVTVTPTNFTSTVQLSVSGLPSHATGSFSPSSLPNGGGTSTLTVDTAKQSRSATLTITGTGGGVTKSTTVSLVLN